MIWTVFTGISVKMASAKLVNVSSLTALPNKDVENVG